jgi:hypothetical protein
MQSVEKTNKVTWYVIDCASRRSSIISSFPFILSANGSTSAEEVLQDPEAVILHPTDDPGRLYLTGRAILNRMVVEKTEELREDQDYALKVGNDLFVMRGGRDLKDWRSRLDVTQWFLFDLQKQSYEGGGPFAWQDIPQKTQGRDPKNTAIVPAGLEEGFLMEHFLPAHSPQHGVAGESAETAYAGEDEMDWEDAQSKLLCPTCRQYFDKGEAMHIAADPMPPDQELKKMGVTGSLRFLATRFNNNNHGIDPTGKPCEYVACPFCRRRLPQSFLDLPHHIVSMVGATKSGKSYYLTITSHESKDILKRSFGIAFADDPHCNAKLIQSRNNFYNAQSAADAVVLKTQMQSGDYYDRVFHKGRLVDMPHPFVFSVMPRRTEQAFSLIFYDHAGEYFQPNRSEEGTIDHVAYASVIFFLFDPAIDTGFRRQLGDSHPDEQLKQRVTAGEQQDVMLKNMGDRVKAELGLPIAKPLDKPLAVLVGKYDMWKDMEIWKDLLSGNDLRPAVRNRSLDMEAVNHNSELVHTLLERLSPGFVANADVCAKDVVYFPVSNFGHTPVLVKSKEGEAFAPDPKLLKPFNVDVPIAWALTKIQPDLFPVLR